MPLHPLAAAAVGIGIGTAAILAPKSPSPDPVADTSCHADCRMDDPAFVVGDVPTGNQVHLITEAGRYGLATPPTGDEYAVVGGYLVRLDRDSDQIRSVLRPAPAILD